MFTEIIWKDRQYHVQDTADVAQKDVIMYYNANQFPELPLCGPHDNLYGALGLSKHYHFRFYPKLDNGVCAIRRIPCACVACTSMPDKPWISGIPSYEQELYKPVTKCMYWPVLWTFKNWIIIQLQQK